MQPHVIPTKGLKNSPYLRYLDQYYRLGLSSSDYFTSYRGGSKGVVLQGTVSPYDSDLPDLEFISKMSHNDSYTFRITKSFSRMILSTLEIKLVKGFFMAILDGVKLSDTPIPASSANAFLTGYLSSAIGNRGLEDVYFPALQALQLGTAESFVKLI